MVVSSVCWFLHSVVVCCCCCCCLFVAQICEREHMQAAGGQQGRYEERKEGSSPSPSPFHPFHSSPSSPNSLLLISFSFLLFSVVAERHTGERRAGAGIRRQTGHSVGGDQCQDGHQRGGCFPHHGPRTHQSPVRLHLIVLPCCLDSLSLSLSAQ